MGVSTAEKYRQFTSSSAINSAKYFFRNLLKADKHPLENFILQISTGKTPPKSVPKYYEQNDIFWFKPSDIGVDVYLKETNSFVSNIAVKDKKATLFEEGTLLITCIGDIGRIGILRNRSSSNQQITGVLTKKSLLPEFAYLYLAAHREDFTDSGVLKTTLPIINQTKIKSLLIKVPPINIQKAVVDFYFEYIEYGLPNRFPVELEEYKEQLINFSKLADSSKLFSQEIKAELTHQQTLLKKLRQQILQEAIEGKLTEEWRANNPSVEPASELLKRIQAEKAQLVKDKKIKKQKPLPPISKDEKSFELPDRWVWCRLGELIYDLQYGTSKKCTYDTNQNTPILRIPNISSGVISDDDLKYTNLTEKEKKQYSLKVNDLLIIRSNGSKELVGKTVLVSGECDQFGYAGYLIRLRFSPDKSNSCYLQKYLGSWALREQIETPLRTTVGINNINSTELSNLFVPLPPLPEQKTIVTKVEKLLAVCEQLETQITHNQSHANALMQAVLKEAFTSKHAQTNNQTEQVTSHT